MLNPIILSLEVSDINRDSIFKALLDCIQSKLVKFCSVKMWTFPQKVYEKTYNIPTLHHNTTYIESTDTNLPY